MGQDQTWIPADGAAFKGSPSVVAWGPGRSDVFVLGGDGSIFHGVNHIPDEPAIGWDDWGIAETNLPCTSAIDSTSSEPGRIDVFCRVDHDDGAPSNIMLRTFDNREDAARTWTWDDGGAGTIPSINGVPLELVGDPDATGWSEGRLDVVMRASDGSYAHGFSDDEWVTQTWESLGRVPCGNAVFCEFAGDPSIANLGDGRFVVAGSALSVTGQGNSLWTRVYDFGLGPWNDSLIFATGHIDLSSW